MVEFNTAPYVPMDRKYHEPLEVESVRANANIEEPVIPMIELGTTVPEQDPAGRFKNMIQGVQASIRRGAGRIQLVFQTPHTSAIGGRPKAYGPEVREQLREVFKANEAILTGIEMPTSSLNNLSGYDPQRQAVSDEVRKNNLDEIRDAVKFAADVAEGGGVDLVSFEFARPIFNAPWNRKDPKTGQQLFQQKEERTIQTVDERTGRISGYRMDEIEKRPIARDRETGKAFTFNIDERRFEIRENGEVIKHTKKLDPWKWEDYEAHAQRESQARAARGEPPITAEEVFMTELHMTNKKQAEGMVAYHEERAKDYRSQRDINQMMITTRQKFNRRGEPTGERLEGAELEAVKKEKARYEQLYVSELGSIESYSVQAEETTKLIEATKPLRVFAKERSILGYAEAGAMAHQETHNNPHAKSPVYVGPEIGWPDYYGGHPAEFRELIHKAREKMIDMLTQKKIQDPKTKEWAVNPYFQPGLSRAKAADEAASHIKGCFDTSHMGMWLKHFRPDLPYEQRVKEFNKWYMEEVEALAKDDVVGSIQLVNSMSSAHGHLPAGQGIFPVVAAAREFKRQGFKGYMVSEGHEEEKFEDGRILVETWRAFNAPFGSTYGPGISAGYRDANNQYAGQTYSPRMMFGSYTPPFGEYKPWSEIPFE